MPATEQGLIIGRLVSEISTARTVEKALYARRLLLSGRQVPEVYATEVARQHADMESEFSSTACQSTRPTAITPPTATSDSVRNQRRRNCAPLLNAAIAERPGIDGFALRDIQ